MAATLTIKSNGELFEKEGSEREIEDFAQALVMRFSTAGGAFVTDESRTVWIPASALVSIDADGEIMSELNALPMSRPQDRYRRLPR